MKRIELLLVALVGACNTGQIPVEAHELGSLEYEMPTSWQSTTHTEAGRQVVQWTPKENLFKESITFIVSEPLPALAKTGPEHTTRYLVDAQLGLRGSFGAPTRIDSTHGLNGARIEGWFTPPHQTRSYDRKHAVVIAGDRLVHVLYTAPRTTSPRDSFSAVLNSLQRKGA